MVRSGGPSMGRRGGGASASATCRTRTQRIVTAITMYTWGGISRGKPSDPAVSVTMPGSRRLSAARCVFVLNLFRNFFSSRALFFLVRHTLVEQGDGHLVVDVELGIEAKPGLESLDTDGSIDVLCLACDSPAGDFTG